LTQRSTVLIVWICVVAVAAAAAAFAVTSLQQDLAAYWIAGKARWFGLDPYVNYCGSDVAPRLCDGVSMFRHSRFLYPPLAAELFRLLAFIPYRAAKFVFTLAAVGCWLLTARIVARRPGGRPHHGAAVIIVGALFFPLYFHLERGQIDLLLLPLVLAAWLQRDRVLLAGGVLALAATFKPALLGVLPVLLALGHRRWVLSTIAGCAVVAAASVAISGPRLVRTYVTTVLPRAALYGEGGTEEMLRPARGGALEAESDDEFGDRVGLEGVSYRVAVQPFDGPASASLPRLIAPESPRWATSVLPFAIIVAGLCGVARRLPRREEDDDPEVLVDPVIEDAHLLLFTSSIVACVVTSPAGWVMGLVWALPIAPLIWTGAGRARLSRRQLAVLGAVWIAAAVFPLINGWAAVAGTALVVATAYAADAWIDGP
jgi:hypothetical protein